MYQSILVERHGPVAWLYLNRPTVLNAISVACMAELIDAATVLRDDRDARVIVISGKGRGFCAGADLTDASVRPGATGLQHEFLEMGERFEALLSTLPKPVIAAVNGTACGGGLELALMCDFIIAAESARIGDAHANFGLLPGGGATVRLPRTVGANWARYLLYTGELLSAAAMADIGLVQRVVADAALFDTVQALALRIAGNSPLGLRGMKTLVNSGMDLPGQQAFAAERAAARAHLQSHDALEGGQAFAQKRKPVFRGN